jgi:hypothetical protein
MRINIADDDLKDERDRQNADHKKVAVKRLVRITDMVTELVSVNPDDKTVVAIELLLDGKLKEAFELLGVAGTEQAKRSEWIHVYQGTNKVDMVKPDNAGKIRHYTDQGFIRAMDDDGNVELRKPAELAGAADPDLPIVDNDGKQTGTKVSLSHALHNAAMYEIIPSDVTPFGPVAVRLKTKGPRNGPRLTRRS